MLVKNVEKSVQEAKQTYQTIWGASCTSDSDSFCGFIETLKGLSQEGEEEIHKTSSSWDDETQDAYKNYTEHVKQLMINYYSQFSDLMSSKKLGCYMTQLRKELDSHKDETVQQLTDFYADSKTSFTSQVLQIIININSYKDMANKIVQKCSVRENPRDCANNFVSKAIGLTDEYKSVIIQAIILIRQQANAVGPDSTEIVQSLQSKDDEFKAVLKLCG